MFIFALGFVSFHCRGECWVRATPLSEPVFKWAPGTPRDLSTNSKLSYEICLQSYIGVLFIFIRGSSWGHPAVQNVDPPIEDVGLRLVSGTSPPRLFKALRGGLCIENGGSMYTLFEYYGLECVFILPIPLKHIHKCSTAVLWNITDLLVILISFFFSQRQVGSAMAGRGH